MKASERKPATAETLSGMTSDQTLSLLHAAVRGLLDEFAGARASTRLLLDSLPIGTKAAIKRLAFAVEADHSPAYLATVQSALQSIVSAAPVDEPEDEVYDSMESAYGNGREVAAWEAATIARDALSSDGIAGQERQAAGARVVQHVMHSTCSRDMTPEQSRSLWAQCKATLHGLGLVQTTRECEASVSGSLDTLPRGDVLDAIAIQLTGVHWPLNGMSDEDSKAFFTALRTSMDERGYARVNVAEDVKSRMPRERG